MLVRFYWSLRHCVGWSQRSWQGKASISLLAVKEFPWLSPTMLFRHKPNYYCPSFYLEALFPASCFTPRDQHPPSFVRKMPMRRSCYVEPPAGFEPATTGSLGLGVGRDPFLRPTRPALCRLSYGGTYRRIPSKYALLVGGFILILLDSLNWCRKSA